MRKIAFIDSPKSSLMLASVLASMLQKVASFILEVESIGLEVESIGLEVESITVKVESNLNQVPHFQKNVHFCLKTRRGISIV